MSSKLVVPDKLTVDWLLDNVDLEFKWYTPSELSIEFMNFIRLVLGEEPENSNPYAHYFMIDTIFSQDNVRPYFEERGLNWNEVKGRTAILACREFSKSTLIGTFLPLFMAWKGELPEFGKVNYGLYVGDSMRNNVKTTMQTIEQVYYESVWLQSQFEYAKFTDEQIELIRLPRSKRELALYQATINAGKRADEVPGRAKRKFAMRGVGAAALPLDAVLYTAQGTTTVGECSIGQLIYGADGKLCTITKKSEVFTKPMYRINLEDGRSIDVCEDHINSIVCKTIPSRKTEYKTLYEKKNVTTLELLNMKLFHTRNRKGKLHRERLLFIENCNSLQYSKKAVPVDAYTLGVFLGDGTIKKSKNSVRITCHKEDLSTYKENIPYKLGKVQTDTRNEHIKTFTILGIGKDIAKLGLAVNSYDKFIPKQYFYCSEEQRLALLQGLIDTDGTISKDRGKARYVSTSKQLAYDVANLVRSLGGRASVTFKKKSTAISYVNDREVTSKRDTYLVYIWLNMPIARLPRKYKLQTYDTTVYGKYVAITSIEEIAIVPSQCIAVDNEDHQFITGDYIRTHNTGTRGTRSGLQRPQFAIFDDLVSSEVDANSDNVLANIESTIESDVLNALHGSGSFAIIIGTPYNKKDPVYKRIESGAWAPVVYPICKEIRLDLKKEEFKGVWEDRHKYEKVMRRYKDAVKNNATRSFMQELMLRITSEEDRLIKDSYINWAKRRDILNNAHSYNWYVTTDFTVSGGKGSDYSGAAVWAISNNDDRILVDLSLKKMELNEQYDNLFLFVNRYTRQGQYIEVGVEIDGQQKTHIYALEQLMMKKGEYFTLARQKGENSVGIRVKKMRGAKHDRFKLTVPLFQQGKIWICEELKGTPDLEKLLEELRFVTVDGFGSNHDDGCDLISMLMLMDIRVPSKSREAYVPDRIPEGEEDFYPDVDYYNTGNNYVF